MGGGICIKAFLRFWRVTSDTYILDLGKTAFYFYSFLTYVLSLVPGNYG